MRKEVDKSEHTSFDLFKHVLHGWLYAKTGYYAYKFQYCHPFMHFLLLSSYKCSFYANVSYLLVLYR